MTRKRIDVFIAPTFFFHTRPDFIFGFTEGQGRCLGKAVRKQGLLVTCHRIVGLDGSNKVARHKTSALVQKLEEGMLAVIAEFPPNHGSRGPGQGLIVGSDGLAVTFHLQLLQERGEELQGVVIGQNRKVLVKGRLTEIVIHFFRGFEQAQKEGLSDLQHERESDSRPQGIPSSDPIPNREDALGGNAELGG